MDTYTTHAITAEQEDVLEALLTALESLQIADLTQVSGMQIKQHQGERQER